VPASSLRAVSNLKPSQLSTRHCAAARKNIRMGSDTITYTEFGFRIRNRRFAVRIPKFKIRAPKLLKRRKYKNISKAKLEEEPDLRLKELNIHYNRFLTVSSENSRRLSSESSDTLRSFESARSSLEEMSVVAGTAETDTVGVDIDFSSSNFETYHMSSTPVSFSLEGFSSERRASLLLKNLSGVKIYEDIEEYPEFGSILEDTVTTAYEEVNNSMRREEVLDRTYESIDVLSSIFL